MSKFVAVCRVEQVAEGRGFPVEVDGLRVAIYRNRGRYFALSGRCPHANGSMGLGWVEDEDAVCPLHRWRFNLATGRCTTVRGHALNRFRCAVHEGQVWVEV